ncbi:DUF1016 N-terminal domain-containing protein [Sphingobacterium kyonggiense]
MKKLNSNDFMISNLKMIAENSYMNISNVINSIVLQLFWRVGMIVKDDTDSNKDIDHYQEVLNDISLKLRPLFGGYLDINQLKLMKKFSEKYNSDRMDKVFDFPDWSVISSSLNNISEEGSSMLAAENPHTETAYHSKVASAYFYGKNRIKFTKLFEPKEDIGLVTYNLPIKMFDREVINKILNEILGMQVHINLAVNTHFNSLFWNIGEGLLESSSHFDVSKADNPVEYCIKELNKSFPSIFNKKHLYACIELVKQYPTSLEFQNISDMVSWPYLKILLKVNNTKEQFYIANLLLIKRMDLSTVKKHISTGLLDEIFNESNPQIEENYKLFKIITEKKGNNSSTGYYYERTNQNHEYERMLNCNIFKNRDLLGFITKSTV